MEIVLSFSQQEFSHELIKLPKKDIAAYLVDLMALIRTLPRTIDTYSELTQKVVHTLPVGNPRVDIVADTNRNDSIKNSERIKHGHSAKVLMKSAVSRSRVKSITKILRFPHERRKQE